MSLNNISGFLIDIINSFCVFLIIVIYGLKIKYSYPIVALLFVSILMPFFTNGLLFEPEYMPDQIGYFNLIRAIRDFSISDFSDIDASVTVATSSVLLSLLPVPLIDSVRSIGVANTLVYLFAFIFFLKKNVFEKSTLYFYLIYPSWHLYSSLALRDTLIALFMMLGFYYSVRGMFFTSFFLILPLLFIKPQNFIIELFFVIVYAIVFTDKLWSKPVVRFAFFIFLLISFFLFVNNLDYLNYYRSAMYAEDGGDPHLVPQIEDILDLFRYGFLSGIYFLAKPFPWEAGNVFQNIQAIESILVCFFIIYLTFKVYPLNPKKTIFWVSFLLISCTIYGLVVFNFGTASRYRFPFILTYITFIVYDIRLLHNFHKSKSIN